MAKPAHDAETSHQDARSEHPKSEVPPSHTKSEPGASGYDESDGSLAGESADRSTVHVPEELQRFLNSVQATVEAAGKMMTEISNKIAQENARFRGLPAGEYPGPGDHRYPMQHDRLLEAARRINREVEQWQAMAAGGQALPWSNPPMPSAYAAAQPMPASHMAAREWAMFAANAARVAQAFANHATMAAGGVPLAQAQMAPFLQI
jgi:hypothetical protein